jgi:hypothetical protein
VVGSFILDSPERNRGITVFASSLNIPENSYLSHLFMLTKFEQTGQKAPGTYDPVQLDFGIAQRKVKTHTSSVCVFDKCQRSYICARDWVFNIRIIWIRTISEHGATDRSISEQVQQAETAMVRLIFCFEGLEKYRKCIAGP